MKAILMSIKPQWVEKILNGIKKDEIRKGTAIGKAINKLIAEQGVAPMLVYCTKNGDYLMKAVNNNGFITCIRSIQPKQIAYSKSVCNGKVVARFNATAEEITTRQDRFKEFVFYETSLDMEDLLKQSCLDYDELDNYLQGEKGTAIHINDLEIFNKPKEISEFKHTIKKYCYNADFDYECVEEITLPLTRAPQSWQFIEI